MNKGLSILAITLLLVSCLSAQDHVVDIKNIHLGDLKIAGFSLDSKTTIRIEAEGAGDSHEREKVRNMMIDPSNMFAYAWILNARTREMVWRMSVDNTSRNRKTRYNRTFDDDVRLPEGEYEVYYSANFFDYGYLDDGFFSLGKLLNKLFKNEKWYEEDRSRWFIRISNVDESVTRSSVEKYHKARHEQAVVSITGLHDSDFRQEGFRLTKGGEFRIYAIGEGFGNESFDYGWIVRADNSEKVWEALAEKSEYAGGAIKNRKWDEKIYLDKGNYWVYFVMDDSHSPGNWNSNPPYDPDFYGISLTGVKGDYDPSSVETLLKLKVEPIVELTRLGDDAFVNEGFKITEPMQVRIYALGEGRDGKMYDYGWISNARTGEKVWEMSYNRTRNAGGAEKNRLIDEVITLPKGTYMVYYQTDGSHSFEDWNSQRPYNPSSWGITVYPADPKYSGEQIQKIREAALESNVIAQIIRVGDGRHIQKRFTLDRETRVRIYGIGEGDWDEMFDYGWIEKESTGEIIWEMTYNKTRWAGGAKKNRKVDQTIMLDRGEYVLHYRTDDSHSFNDWNADAPDDPIHYGITIYQKGEE